MDRDFKSFKSPKPSKSVKFPEPKEIPMFRENLLREALMRDVSKEDADNLINYLKEIMPLPEAERLKELRDIFGDKINAYEELILNRKPWSEEEKERRLKLKSDKPELPNH